MIPQIYLPKIDYKRMTNLIFELSTSFMKVPDQLQQLLSQLFGYHSSIFWEIDQKGNLHNPINYGISDHFMDDYLNFFYMNDYLHPKKQLHIYEKAVALRLEDVIPFNNYECSGYYKDFMKKYGYYYEMVIPIKTQNRFFGVLGLARTIKEKPFTEADLTLFHYLSPIIANLLYLERQYEEELRNKDILEAFAFTSDTGCIVLDDKFEVTYMNPAVLEICRENAAHKNIESFIEELITVIKNRSTCSPLLLLQGYKVKVTAKQELFSSRASRYAVIIEKDIAAVPTNNEKIITELTDREKETYYFLKNGFTYKEISERMFISVNTVNKHVKNIYQKLGINRRALLQAQS